MDKRLAFRKPTILDLASNGVGTAARGNFLWRKSDNLQGGIAHRNAMRFAIAPGFNIHDSNALIVKLLYGFSDLDRATETAKSVQYTKALVAVHPDLRPVLLRLPALINISLPRAKLYHARKCPFVVGIVSSRLLGGFLTFHGNNP